MLFQGGIYLLTLVDWYAATFSVTIFALLEILVMTYVYGKKLILTHLRLVEPSNLYKFDDSIVILGVFKVFISFVCVYIHISTCSDIVTCSDKDPKYFMLPFYKMNCDSI